MPCDTDSKGGDNFYDFEYKLARCLLQWNTPGNLSDVRDEPEQLLLRCKQLYERYLFHITVLYSNCQVSVRQSCTEANATTCSDF